MLPPAGIYLRVYAASQPTTTTTSSSPPWEPQTSSPRRISRLQFTNNTQQRTDHRAVVFVDTIMTIRFTVI
jgi:hypothetical protein